MADRYLGTDQQRKTDIRVQHAAILHVGTRADGDGLGITAQHRVEPDAGILFDQHAPKHGGILRHPVASVRWHLDADAVELVECHWLRPVGQASSRSRSRMAIWNW